MQYLRYIVFTILGICAALIPLGFFASWFFSVSPPVDSASHPEMTATQIEDTNRYRDGVLHTAVLVFLSAGAIAGYMYARAKAFNVRNADQPKPHALD